MSMEKNILKHFENIVANFGDDGLSVDFFKRAGNDIIEVCQTLNLTGQQAALLALIMENEPISQRKLAQLLKCSKIQFYQYLDDLDYLKNNKLVKYLHVRSSSGSGMAYVIPMNVIDSIRNGEKVKNETYKNLEPEDFFKTADSLLSDINFSFGSDTSDFDDFKIELNLLLESNKQLTFVKKANEYDLKEGSIIVLLIFCCYFLYNSDEGELMKLSFLSRFIPYGNVREIAKRFKSKEHKLLAKDIVEPANVNGMADTEYYKLSQKAKNEFLADIDIKKFTKKKGKNFISADEIKEKKLFYNADIRDRVDELARLLQKDNFLNIQKRLAESGMRTGFACIFSGPPGTGKTETVYQIARETGRDIYLVDISETKSAWFGESEKRIKEVFERYKGMVNTTELAPILLFNEADAVLGKRQELSGSRQGPGQTENAIQNIILQEMENLSGILIATTNMTANLDKAFERRFLYKIEFEKPDTESKALIWRSFMPKLSAEEASHLAKTYDYSGGQIENIARKSEVSNILNDEETGFCKIENFCKEEVLEKEAKRIGFNA